MKNQFYPSERGQAVIILVLAMVVLLGFTALAVDGSMLYSDRRYAQSGADASSLAGGADAVQAMTAGGVTFKNWNTNANCTSGNVYTSGATNVAKSSAISRAASNDFTITSFNDVASMTTAQHGVATACGEEPVYAQDAGGGQYVHHIDKFMDVYTMITQDTQTAFIHFVYEGAAKNTVTAVTRARPFQPAAYGYAIVSMNEGGCSGDKLGTQARGLGGSNELYVDGGGIFSNGCLDADGSVSVTVNNGSVGYFYTANHSTVDVINVTNGEGPAQLDDIESNRIPISSFDLPLPDCTAADAHNNVNASYLTNISNLPLSGLYCVDGNVTINNKDLYGTNVTLLFRGGTVTINGSANTILKAPPQGYTGSAMPGVLIYMPKQYYGPTCVEGVQPERLTINGNTGNYFEGTILAPYTYVKMLGNSDNFLFNTQIIGCNVDVGGSTGTRVVYDQDKQLQFPGNLDLKR